MPVFYVDESGFTGEDLHSVDQPIFSNATCDLSESESDDLIKSIFSTAGVEELKYSRLRRNKRHQERIVELISLVGADPSRAATWVAHKEFSLLTLVVDWWVEPLTHKYGYNLYQDGASLGLANMMFYCLESFWSRQFRRKLLLHFQKMMRVRSALTFNQCQQLVYKASQKADENQEGILQYLRPSFELLGFEHVRQLPKPVLDIAFPGLAFLGHTWRDRHAGPWEVVHDESTNMAKQKWLWDALSGVDVEHAQFEGPAGVQHFPMNVISTRFENSLNSKQLQICDILAGASAEFLRHAVSGENVASDYVKKLGASGIKELIVGSIWPSTDVTPEDLGMRGWDGNHAVEWLSGQLEARAGR